MKVYLDDEREAPDGWVRRLWPAEVIADLKTRKVTHLSLDHDLGDDEKGTGYDVLKWIEERVVADETFIPPKTITIHSANASVWTKMSQAIDSIHRLAERFNKVELPKRVSAEPYDPSHGMGWIIWIIWLICMIGCGPKDRPPIVNSYGATPEEAKADRRAYEVHAELYRRDNLGEGPPQVRVYIWDGEIPNRPGINGLATYQPPYRIDLVRTPGLGALTHEWHHFDLFFNHYVGDHQHLNPSWVDVDRRDAEAVRLYSKRFE